MNTNSIIRLSAIVTFIIGSACFGESHDVAAALADRAKFAEEQRESIYYLTLNGYAGIEKQNLTRAIKLMIASASKQPILERCVPTEVNADLLRINIADLGWAPDDWREVAQNRNPYTLDMPIVVRADWLLVHLSDSQESDSYTRLMFGGNNMPKTADDVRKFFHVDNDESLRFGLIEGQSGVNVQGTRWIESRPISRGYYWHTEDALKLDAARDPLEHPGGGYKHDGEEHIIGMPKFSTLSGQRGALQWYFLANGEGLIVPRAPVDLVIDHNKFRGFPEIRTAGSCIICHDIGLNPFKRNELREQIKSGVVPFAEGGKYEQIEIFHLADPANELARANEDFQMAVALVCGCTSREASASFAAAVSRYDAPLTLEQVAREMYCDVEKMTEVLQGTLPARLASLTKGNELELGEADIVRSKRGTVPRAAFEQYALGIERSVMSGGAITIVEKVKVEPKAEPAEEEKPAEKPAVTSPRGRK